MRCIICLLFATVLAAAETVPYRLQPGEGIDRHIAQGTAIIYFDAPWCAPCKVAGPVMDQVAREHGIRVIQVDYDDHPVLVDRFEVDGVPFMVLVRDGAVAIRRFGVPTVEQVVQAAKAPEPAAENRMQGKVPGP
jgi:thioredoxin 1